MDPIGKVNILVVDDRQDKLLALEALLDELGENVVLARSGREALRHVLRHEFAVILLDINMPGMDGFETAQLIRERRGSRQTPIIFLTALADDLNAERSYELGAVDFLLTPVVPAILRTKVAVFVDLFRKAEQIRRQADSLRRRATQLHKLTGASLAINAALSLDRMLQAITDQARDIIGTHVAVTTVALGPEPERCKTTISLSAKGADQVVPLARAGGALYELARSSGGPLRLTQREIEAHPDWSLAAEAEPARGGPREIARPVRGFLGIQLTAADGGFLGVLQLSDKIDGELDDEDEAILVQLAQLASSALQSHLHAAEREASRLKDEFLATLSHELRTPLTAILGWTRILRTRSPEPAQTARGLEVIERNVQAQSRLIEDLLDVSRITSGKLRLDASPVPLASLVEAAVDGQRPAAEARSISLSLRLDAGEGQVEGDPGRLHQVVSNLLTNALKFTPRGGRVEVALSRSSEALEFVVRDSGEGIARDFLPLVFERFRQADSGTQRAHGGLGIGLAIVRHVVELHGGTVRAESPGRGQGATFTVRLPALAEACEPSSEALDRTVTRSGVLATVRSLEGLRVLLVDDDADGREMMKEVLLQHRAEVVALGSAQEALDALGAVLPDVLVSDVAMPGMGGYELIREVRLRPTEGGGDTPALALTAHAHREDRVRALSAGFQMHAAKPIEPDALVTAVATLASGREPPARGQTAGADRRG